MNYVLDPSCGVRAFESDGSQDFLITPEMRPLTAEEVQDHLNPRPTFQNSLARLNEDYQAYLQKLSASYSMAILADGASEAAKVANIRAQYIARKDLHTANVAALKLEYGV